MKNLCLPGILLFIFLFQAKPQDTDHKLYNPELNALVQLDESISMAEAHNKHVLVFVGGNWCSWCIKMDQFIRSHYSIDSLIQSDYISIHLNYSPENRNPEAMARLEYPQRFGFPVIVILDETGRRIHTQNTAFLEQQSSYNDIIFLDFLKSWNKNAVNSENYH